MLMKIDPMSVQFVYSIFFDDTGKIRGSLPAEHECGLQGVLCFIIFVTKILDLNRDSIPLYIHLKIIYVSSVDRNLAWAGYSLTFLPINPLGNLIISILFKNLISPQCHYAAQHK